MTQKNEELIELISKKLNSICDRILSYQKVDATLSDKTLLETLVHLNLADGTLEEGFVKDACNEIDEVIMIN